jgi:3-methyladenine DNA glycosylase AlkD
MDNWGAVDQFAMLAGPAWRSGQVSDACVLRWARSPSRWWRRAALVCTVFLNRRSQGGEGDVRRTLMICEPLAGDRDEMVAKAMSWALRDLLVHDRKAVRALLPPARRPVARPREARGAEQAHDRSEEPSSKGAGAWRMTERFKGLVDPVAENVAARMPAPTWYHSPTKPRRSRR